MVAPMAKPGDILDYLKRNGCKRRKDIVQYMTEDIEKRGISSISPSTVDGWLRSLTDTKKITHVHTDYCLAKPKTVKKRKKAADPTGRQKNQDIVAAATAVPDKEAKATAEFSRRVEEEVHLAKSLQETAFLLEPRHCFLARSVRAATITRSSCSKERKNAAHTWRQSGRSSARSLRT